MTCRFAHDDAAYVLGALAPTERLELERHLDGCPACTRRIREVAGLSGLLARVSPEVLEADEQGRAPGPGPTDTRSPDSGPSTGPPDSVLPRLLQAVRRDRRRRRWVEAGLVAAAGVVGVVLAGGITGGLTGDDPGGGPQGTPAAPTTSTASPSPSRSPSPATPPTARARPMRPVGDTSMTVELAMTQVPWGTRFDLTCRYPETDTAGPGRPTYRGGEGTSYALVVRTRDGDLEQVATWHALPGQTMQLTAPTATRLGRIAEVQVRSADGSPLLQLRG